MKILMVNKFLYPKGGSETYVFKLGRALIKQGHEVQYFGMEHEGRLVGNQADAYTADMDFHRGSYFSKLAYPIKTIYSAEARKKIRLVLEDFQPDAVHLNNFNYQLTPSIILEIDKWRKKGGRKCRIVFTAHDFQLICPNHMLHNPNTHENCEKCLGGHFGNCVRGRCIHGSALRSLLGSLEAFFWNKNGVYKKIDRVICCSAFMKRKIDTNPIFHNKSIEMHNFIEIAPDEPIKKRNYIIYFGRFSEEKGVKTLLSVCEKLPDIPFVFAGSGSLEKEISRIPNVKNVGFQTGEKLEQYIKEAKFSICPSELYENCPFSVMESQMLGTPVLGADIGGIPELIQEGVNGFLFKAKDAGNLMEKIQYLWGHETMLASMTESCKQQKVMVDTEYADTLINGIYQ